MARHGRKRSRPAALVPGTLHVISVRMDYWPGRASRAAGETLADPLAGYVARYALGRDYHRLMRRRLQRLAERIGEHVGPFGYRAFVDSAPVLERALARDAGLGWIGKHTNLINPRAGVVVLPGRALHRPASSRQPRPRRPLRALSGLYRRLPDRRDRGSLRAGRTPLHRLSDDRAPRERSRSSCAPPSVAGSSAVTTCQLVCPWNRFAPDTAEPDFAPRHRLDRSPLVDLFAWDESDFERYTEGSAIRRLGHERWLRNVAVALGNAPTTEAVVNALRARRGHPSALVREHVAWALGRHHPGRSRHRYFEYLACHPPMQYQIEGPPTT